MGLFGCNINTRALEQLLENQSVITTAMVEVMSSQMQLIRSVNELKEQVRMSHEEISAKLEAAVAANDANVDKLITIAEANAATLKEIVDNSTDFASLKAAVLAQVDKLDEQNAQTRAALDAISPPVPPAPGPTPE